MLFGLTWSFAAAEPSTTAVGKVSFWPPCWPLSTFQQRQSASNSIPQPPRLPAGPQEVLGMWSMERPGGEMLKGQVALNSPIWTGKGFFLLANTFLLCPHPFTPIRDKISK